jgi:hypothetical protein
MTGRALLAASLVLAIGPALHAQDGLRSASLPERPIATQPPGPEDLFRARPDTYRPRPHRPRPEPVGRWPYWPYVDVPQPVLTRPFTEPVLLTGFLQVHVAPGSALVYIDGGYQGTADELRWPGTRLRAGVHRIRIDAPGYESRTLDVRLSNGETTTYNQALERSGRDPRSGTDVPPPPKAMARLAEAGFASEGGYGTSVTPAVPGSAVSKTMYVIPRCYAGDKPPDPGTNCDLTKLRTIR